MLKIQEIIEIMKAMGDSNLDEFEYEQDEFKLKLKKHKNEVVYQQAPAAVNYEVKQVTSPVVEAKSGTEQQEKPSEVAADANLHRIESPMVGTFYAAPSPEDEPYVKVGDKVNENTVVCIVEAMKLFNEIEAEVKGEIVEVLVENGQLVEYGQPLFLVKPE